MRTFCCARLETSFICDWNACSLLSVVQLCCLVGDGEMITVIDYKAGNLTSVLKALRHLGAESVVTDGDLSLVESAERIVLPGVGHFAATERLDSTGLTHAIRSAIARGVPFLGICVGMQWLYAGSTEAPSQPGLGAFAESCARFSESQEKVPHVGWNSLEVKDGSRLDR